MPNPGAAPGFDPVSLRARETELEEKAERYSELNSDESDRDDSPGYITWALRRLRAALKLSH